MRLPHSALVRRLWRTLAKRTKQPGELPDTTSIIYLNGDGLVKTARLNWSSWLSTAIRHPPQA